MQMNRLVIVPAFCVVLLPFSFGIEAESALNLTYEGSTLWSGETCVSVKDSVAYCVYSYGIVAYDFGDTSNIFETGRAHISLGTPAASIIEGNLLFVLSGGECDWSGGVHIFDVDNPSSPTRVSGIELPSLGILQEMDVHGGYAYITTNSSGLRIIDVRNPLLPVDIGGYGSGVFGGVRVLDTILYATRYPDSDLTVLNVSDPMNPSLVGALDTTGLFWDLDLAGPYLLISADLNRLLTVDVLDPAAPAAVQHLQMEGFNKVFVMDSVAGLFGSDSVRLLDISIPTSPQPIGSIGEEYCSQLDREGSIVVAAGIRGVAWYDCAMPHTPQLLEQRRGGHSYDAAVVLPFAFLADGSAGLRVVDVSNPHNPIPVGVLSPEIYEHAEAIAVSGNYAYLAEEGDGVAIVDITDPALPVEVHRVFAGDAKSLVAAGNFVYVADQAYGLRIIDISTPTAAYERDSVPGVGEPFGVAVEGDFAYVAGDTALFAVDVSDPDSIFTVSRHDPNGRDVREVIVSGNLAYLTLDEDGLEILDVSDPSAPVLLGSLLSQGFSPRYLSKHGDYLYVNDGSNVSVLDVSDPQRIAKVDSFCTPGVTGGLMAAQGYVWVPDGDGFLILSTGDGPSCSVSVTGDANATGTITSADIITLVNFVFKGGLSPQPCEAAADVNCNGTVTSSDIVTLVNHVFKGGMAPCDVCLVVPLYWTCP